MPWLVRKAKSGKAEAALFVSAAIHSRSSIVYGVVTGLSDQVAPPSVEVETSTFASERLAT